MALFDTISDDFNDNSVGAIWTNNYGGAIETNQRAQVPCVSGSYAGYQTAKDYTLDESSLLVEIVTVPAASTATDMNMVFGVIGPTDGTNLQFNINPAAGTLRLESNVAYFDAGATSLTFSHATHRWFRYREESGTLYWDTSTNGISWTNRRSLTTPAWVAAAADDLAIDMFCFRDDGTTDYGEYDNLNLAPSAASTLVAKIYKVHQQAIRRAHNW